MFIVENFENRENIKMEIKIALNPTAHSGVKGDHQYLPSGIFLSRYMFPFFILSEDNGIITVAY